MTPSLKTRAKISLAQRRSYAKNRRGRNRRILDHKQHILDNSILDPVTGCRNWQMAKNNLGYGLKCYEGKMQTAHRVAYKEWKGSIPKGMCVLHSCNNPSCCAHYHLRLGTRKENSQQMVAEGRNVETVKRLKQLMKQPARRAKMFRGLREHNKRQKATRETRMAA